MYIGYSRPNSAFTLASAASIADLFSVREKSTKASLVNSGRLIVVSAVAMRLSSSMLNPAIVLRGSQSSQSDGQIPQTQILGYVSIRCLTFKSLLRRCGLRLSLIEE